MAATHVYASVVRIPLESGDVDDAYFTGTTPLEATSAAFPLKGGLYGVDVIAATYGTVTLKRLGQDGSTYLTALTAFSANGYATAYLPPGTYELVVA